MISYKFLSRSEYALRLPNLFAGANLAVDIPWKWLNFFLDDDAELKIIGEEYAAGRMLTGQVKKRLIEVRWPG